MDPNWVEPDQESAPNLEINHQNHAPIPAQNLGSRFHALAALDLNMEMKDHNVEAKARQETHSNQGTNSSLVTTVRAESGEQEERQNGNSNLGDKEIDTRINPIVPNTATIVTGTRVT